MESNVLRLSKATGKQLQEAARHARLQDVPNEVYGLQNAMFASDPSPLQVNILRKGLKAAGWNYVKVTEVCEPATEVDRIPSIMRAAVAAMAKEVRANLSVERVAAKVLYRTVPCASEQEALTLARFLIAHRGFTPLQFEGRNQKAWAKTVKLDNNRWTAVVEVKGDNLRLSAYRGA